MPKKKAVNYEGAFQQQLEAFAAQAEARKELAIQVYDHQDAGTQEAIEIIRDQIVHMSRGEVTLKIGSTRRVFTLPADTIQANAFYAAVEIVKDLAIMDIRIGNFKFDLKHCAECGAEIKPKKKGKS